MARRAVPGRGVSRRRDLRPLLAPRSIAIVGASESPDSWAPEIERSLRHLGLRGRAVSDQPEVRRGLGTTLSEGDRRAAARRRPRGVRGARPRGRAHDRRLWRRGCEGDHGRVLRLRRGGRGGPHAPGGAAGGRRAHRDPGARAQRRGLRELRRPRGALRDDAAPDPAPGHDQRDLAVGHRRVDDEPARLGSWGGTADHPGGGERGGARARRPVRVGGRTTRARRS